MKLIFSIIAKSLFNPTKIAHDSFSALYYLLKMQLPPFYDVADFSQEVLGYWCERIFHSWRNFFKSLSCNKSFLQ